MLEVRKIPHKLSWGEITELINIHGVNQYRMEMLMDYYNGKSHGLLNQKNKPSGKADNRIFFPFPYLITSTICGFLNIPPQVRCEDKDIQEMLDDCFKYSDAPKQITSELLDMSIYGCAVEQLYIDKNAITRFKHISPLDIIVVKSNDIIGDIFLVIKHFKINGLGENKDEYIELYYEDEIIKYVQKEDGSVIDVVVEPNYFKDVPFVIFKNNESMLGDFERVIPLIDGYSKYQSEVLNATEDLTNSLMLISGVTLSDEQLEQVKYMRVLADENDIDAKMIANDVVYNDTYATQMRKNIFSLSSVVDLTDSENVGNALSGSALKHRLVNLLYLCSVKANYVRESVLRRVELILNVHSLTHAINIDDIIANTIIDVRYNTLEDNTEILNLVNGLQDIVSTETLLGMLGDLIISVDDELEKLQKEKEENIAQFSFMQDANGHLTSNAEDEEQGDADEEETTEEV